MGKEIAESRLHRRNDGSGPGKAGGGQVQLCSKFPVIFPLTMSRPLRIEFPDALYHVTARGDRREDIFEDDADHCTFLLILAQVIARFNWICHA